MKYIFYITACTLIFCTLYGQLTTQQLKQGCDELYTRDIQRILTQFKGLATQAERDDYKEFMNGIKLHADLEFKITPFEARLTADLLAKLRMPLQRYSECRTSLSSRLGLSIQTAGLSERQLRPCDKTYAVLVQQTLMELRDQIAQENLKEFQDYMILLKYKTDLAFDIGEFEKRTQNVTTSRLRLPLQQYQTCRDSLIRMGAPAPSLS